MDSCLEKGTEKHKLTSFRKHKQSRFDLLKLLLTVDLPYPPELLLPIHYMILWRYTSQF